MKKRFIIKSFIFVVIIAVTAAFAVSRLFPTPYTEYVTKAAEKNNVDEVLVYALIKAESNFDKTAVSGAQAKGLMQLADSTADWCASCLGYGEYNVFDPETNIELGTFYLAYLLKKYDGNKALAIAAYNAGHGRVDEWLKNESLSDDGKTLKQIPYPETDRHIKKIEFYEKAYDIILSHSE